MSVEPEPQTKPADTGVRLQFWRNARGRFQARAIMLGTVQPVNVRIERERVTRTLPAPRSSARTRDTSSAGLTLPHPSRLRQMIGKVVYETLKQHGVPLSREARDAVERDAEKALVDQQQEVKARDVQRNDLAERRKLLQSLRLAEMLVVRTKATNDQLEQALEMHRLTGQRLGDIFVAMKVTTEAEMKQLVEEQLLSVGRVQALIEDTSRRLQEERDRKIDEQQFTVSAKGVTELEGQFESIVSRAIMTHGASKQTAEELRSLVSHLLDEERERIAEQARSDQSKRMAVLERKIKRLSGSLLDVEKERDQHRRHAEALQKHGVTIPRGAPVQTGLDEEDPDKERKLELLKDIFQQNREMRAHLSGKRLKPAAPAVPVRKAPRPKPPEPEPPAEREPDPTPEEDQVSAEEIALAFGDDQTDPDDQVWEPGMSFRSEPIDQDDDDEEDAVPRMDLSRLKTFAPPPLERG